MILEILATILILIADWQLFKKMGREGWEGIIPLYNKIFKNYYNTFLKIIQ